MLRVYKRAGYPLRPRLLREPSTESSFSNSLGHISTTEALLSHLTFAGLTQEKDKGDKTTQTILLFLPAATGLA